MVSDKEILRKKGNKLCVLNNDNALNKKCVCMINIEYQRQNLSSHLKQQQQQKNRQIQDNRHWKIKGIIH